MAGQAVSIRKDAAKILLYFSAQGKAEMSKNR